MNSKSFSYTGLSILLTGLVLTGFGGVLFGQVFPCIMTSNIFCGASASQEAASTFGYIFPILISGGFLIIIGAIFIASGHITENLRSMKESTEVKEEPGSQDHREKANH